MNRPQGFQIVDSTLREGEQYAGVRWTSADRIRIARELDAFGVQYIEMTSPAASPRSAADLTQVARLGLNAKVLTHVRCRIDDAQRAVAAGARGVNLLFGTSPLLRAHSHGRGIDDIIREAREVVVWLQQHGVEIRFSCEDAFRTPLKDLLRIYQAVDGLGVHRVGVADTVGAATPRDVEEVVRAVRKSVFCDIEFHGHNDGGCAIANAHAALESGATHISATVLGLGERNGITALSGLIARIWMTDPVLLRGYRLDRLAALDALVSDRAGVPIPFNACITGPHAFTHKAGLHTKAVLQDPRTYETLDPAVFGREREVLVAHHLCGRHSVAHRAEELGISLTDAEIGAATRELKATADRQPVSDGELDALLLRHASREAVS